MCCESLYDKQILFGLFLGLFVPPEFILPTPNCPLHCWPALSNHGHWTMLVLSIKYFIFGTRYTQAFLSAICSGSMTYWFQDWGPLQLRIESRSPTFEPKEKRTTGSMFVKRSWSNKPCMCQRNVNFFFSSIALGQHYLRVLAIFDS